MREEPVREEPVDYSHRNAVVLADFVTYCAARPRLRFWQALASWAEGTAVYLELPGGLPGELPGTSALYDTWNWEGKRYDDLNGVTRVRSPEPG